MKKTLTIILTIFVSFYLQLNIFAESTLDKFLVKPEEKYTNVTIDKVITADTIIILNNRNEKEFVKLIGLKAPDAPDKKIVNEEHDQYGFVIEKEIDPEEASTIEELAFIFTKSFLTNEKVRLEFDKQKKDSELKTLAYVFLEKDGTFVNAEILRQGFANLSIQPPNKKYAEKLRSAYQEARKEFRGLHSQ